MIVAVTYEGDPVLTEAVFDGSGVTVTWDGTRDQWMEEGGRTVRKATYSEWEITTSDSGNIIISCSKPKNKQGLGDTFLIYSWIQG